MYFSDKITLDSSNTIQKYVDLETNKKKHPINYISHMENILGIELKFYQKLLLMIFIYFNTKEKNQLKKFQKIINKYINS